MTRDDRKRLAPHIPVMVYGMDPEADPHCALRDSYIAAIAGLDAATKKKRGAKEKLAYIIRRIEQHYEYPDCEPAGKCRRS